MTKPKKLLLSGIAPLVFLLSSCHLLNILDTSGNYDYGKGGILLDTQKNRNLTLGTYARQIEMEASGKYPEHDWIGGWINAVEALSKGNRENPEFYVNFIINRRRELGLPELGL